MGISLPPRTPPDLDAFGSAEAVITEDALVTASWHSGRALLPPSADASGSAEEATTEDALVRASRVGSVWRSMLAAYPSQVGSFLDPTTFLDVVVAGGESVTRFLDIWGLTLSSAADHHLADTVHGLNVAERRPAALATWLRRETVRDRLYRTFERDHATPWGDDLARVYDLGDADQRRAVTIQARESKYTPPSVWWASRVARSRVRACSAAAASRVASRSLNSHRRNTASKAAALSGP